MNAIYLSTKRIAGLVLMLITGWLIISCSERKDEILNIENANSLEVINYATKVADIHNEGLDYCFNELNKSLTKGSLEYTSKTELIEQLFLLTNQFINQKAEQLSLPKGDIEDVISVDMLSTMDINDIREKMSSNELYYVDQILMIAPTNTVELSNIQNLAIKDENLPALNKKAICGFIRLYNKSHEYWNKNQSVWDSYINMTIGKNHQLTKAAASDVALADCYWLWLATVSSAGNLLVGGGAALVGSGAAALNN